MISARLVRREMDATIQPSQPHADMNITPRLVSRPAISFFVCFLFLRFPFFSQASSCPIQKISLNCPRRSRSRRPRARGPGGLPIPDRSNCIFLRASRNGRYVARAQHRPARPYVRIVGLSGLNYEREKRHDFFRTAAPTSMARGLTHCCAAHPFGGVAVAGCATRLLLTYRRFIISRHTRVVARKVKEQEGYASSLAGIMTTSINACYSRDRALSVGWHCAHQCHDAHHHGAVHTTYKEQ